MCELSNHSGSNSSSTSSWTDGSFANSFTGQDYYSKIIAQANSISIFKIFKLYNVKASQSLVKIICPFKTHKGGHEKTPSFQVFFETNSFYCHGCTSWGKGTDFVSKMDGISKVEAAQKILSLFQINFDENIFLDNQDNSEKLQLLIKFSDAVRNFRHSHFNEKSEIYIENICLIYDDLYSKYKIKINNNILKSIISKLIYVIDSYKD